MGDTTGERSRLPIRADLPDDLRALLAEMERLADTSQTSFPKVLDKIFEAGGGRHRPSRVTAWRAGEAFPPEPIVRSWASVCGGDLARIMILHAAAETAYRQWRGSGRGGRSSPSPAPAEPAGVPASLALDSPASNSAALDGSTSTSLTSTGSTENGNSPTETRSAGVSSVTEPAASSAIVTGPPQDLPVLAGAGESPWWRTRRAAVAAGVVVILIAAGAGWRWWPHDAKSAAPEHR